MERYERSLHSTTKDKVKLEAKAKKLREKLKEIEERLVEAGKMETEMTTKLSMDQQSLLMEKQDSEYSRSLYKDKFKSGSTTPSSSPMSQMSPLGTPLSSPMSPVKTPSHSEEHVQIMIVIKGGKKNAIKKTLELPLSNSLGSVIDKVKELNEGGNVEPLVNFMTSLKTRVISKPLSDGGIKAGDTIVFNRS